jgi:hypothetical protein
VSVDGHNLEDADAESARRIIRTNSENEYCREDDQQTLPENIGRQGICTL